ncbi:MAG: serine/threonine-protein kinase, partial [Acidobacteriota bacterium]|nr:serine/threonine-protein kinase [Acidobacteriota bacterium]
MDPRRWKRLQEIFEKVVDLPPEKQAEALARECGEDDELRRRIESLLASSDRGTGLISGAIDRAAADTTGPAVAGERIGPYRLLEEIGSGGMGAVYLAERADEEFEQRVALKVVRAGALNPRIVERFLAERQFLARLDHPHIARLLDGGTTEAGVPYFIMEHVDGIPIDEYCDSKRLSTRERLELFRSVCGAVESAHRKLIVHRDIKPSNLLVTPEGVPKLLDFGIAKLVEPEAPGEALTVMGERAMTPEYASPEQVRGEPVSTATDVYALGLLLYKLLSGRRAHRITSYQPSDVERIVCEAIPERPSTAITSIPAEEPQTSGDGSTVTPESIGRARRTVPARLKKRLAGDLDNIVLMALRKEPERRYPSIEQLSEDIRRHLKGLPVLAHADSFGYRASKFVRRNAGGLTAAVLVFLSLAGGLVVSTVQAKRAKLEARHAAEVTDFLTGLLEVSDPELAQGREVPVREVLDLAAFRIEGELGDQPRVQARIGTLIGHLYHRIGQYEEADRLLSQALVRQEILLGTNHLDVAATQQLVAELADSRGKYEAAEAAALANLEILEGRLG